MLALLYFFHVFCILTFHSVFHEPVRGSQNAGRAVIYAAALWRLAHSRCEKICSLRVAAPHTALFMTLGLSIVLRAVGFSYIVWLYFFYLYIFLSPPPLPWPTGPERLALPNAAERHSLHPKKQTNQEKKWLAWTNKMTLCLKMFSLSLFSLCSSLQAVETNLASKDSHWVYANEVRPDTNTCTHLCTCKTGQWLMLMQPGSRCCVATAHGKKKKKKSRHIFSFF